MHSESRQADGWLFPEGDCRPYAEPVLVSACFLGIPCRWHARRAKRRDALLRRLKGKYVLVPVCPEQLGGMPTPRSGEYLRGGTGADVLDGRLRIVDPATGEDLTEFHVARRAYLKGGSPCCDREGVTGELLRRAAIEVVRVP